MTGTPENPNLIRRSWPGLGARMATPLLKPVLRLFRKTSAGQKSPLIVFQSYLVGDFFMALPALKILSREIQIEVLCRQDCVELLRREGLKGIVFDNGFFLRPGLGSFFRTFRSAWKLRGQLGGVALDFDADPRTAFWLKIAGVSKIISYSRAHAELFDVLFPINAGAIHQEDKNLAVASGFLEQHLALNPDSEMARPSSAASLPDWRIPASDFWIISCWTRKDTKNWPLNRWEQFLDKLSAAGIPFRILKAPDGDAAFREFQSRRPDYSFIRGSLAQIAEQVQASNGVITTDNFIGHMAAYYSKRVLWINGSSDPRQVLPRGPKTLSVQIDPMPCRPCGHRCVNPDYKACLNHLEAEDVWNAFEEIRRG